MSVSKADKERIFQYVHDSVEEFQEHMREDAQSHASERKFHNEADTLADISKEIMWGRDMHDLIHAWADEEDLDPHMVIKPAPESGD